METFPGYDSRRTRTPYDDEPEHLAVCPMHEDNHDGDQAECTCPTPDELKAEAAEWRADARNDRAWEDEMGGGR